MTAMRTMGLAPVVPCDARVDEFVDEYVVRLPVPGFAQQELDVEIAGNVVTVRGDQTETGRQPAPFRIHERVEERFELPADADAAALTASYSGKALQLRAPRTNGRQEGSRTVPIVHRFAVNADASGV
jgi:HSP20 family molecular chaperone IbpA